MNKMKKAVLIFCLLVNLTLWAQQPPKCLYVTTAEAEVYKEMKITRPAFMLQIGDIVAIEEYTGKFGEIRLNGKKQKFEWLKVYYGNKLDVNGEDRLDEYMPSVYLSSHLDKLPFHLVDDYSSLVLANEAVITVEKTAVINYCGDDMMYPWGSSCACFDYLSEGKATYGSYNEAISDSILAPGNPLLDTLKYFIEIEEVDKKITQKKIKNPYSIDTGKVKMRWLKKEEGDIRLVDRFYLYVNDEKDSVLINGQAHESGSAMAFAGQLPIYNKYLLRWESFFHNGYSFIDKTTGEESEFTHGEPLISPGGKFVVDYYPSIDYELEEVYGTVLSLSSISDSAKLKRHITVNFRNFIPLDGAFWVSESELVLAIQPIDNFYHSDKEAIKSDNKQYIKLKVVYFDK